MSRRRTKTARVESLSLTLEHGAKYCQAVCGDDIFTRCPNRFATDYAQTEPQQARSCRGSVAPKTSGLAQIPLISRLHPAITIRWRAGPKSDFVMAIAANLSGCYSYLVAPLDGVNRVAAHKGSDFYRPRRCSARAWRGCCRHLRWRYLIAHHHRPKLQNCQHHTDTDHHPTH